MPRRDPNRRLGQNTPERDAVIEQLNTPRSREYQARVALANGADDPEAAIQDAWEGVLAYDDPARIRNTFNGAVANRGRDQGRRRVTPAGRLIGTSKEEVEERTGLPLEASDHGNGDPLETVIVHETYREAGRLLQSASLSTTQRYILARAAQEADFGDIAQELGWSGKNTRNRVRTELSRGQEKMRAARDAEKER